MSGDRSKLLVLAFVCACATAPPPPVATPTPPPPDEPAPWLASEVVPTPPPTSEPTTRGAVVPAGLRGRILSSRWSPDGTTLAVVTTEKVVGLVDPRTGELRATRRIRVRRDSHVELSAFDGTRLLISHGQYGESGGVLVWDVVADTWRVASEGYDVATGIDLTPRGVVVAGDDAIVHIDDDGRRLVLTEATDRRVLVTDDRLVVTDEAATELLAIPGADDTAVRRIARVPGAARAVRPRGGLLATVEGDLVRIARLSDGALVWERPVAGLRALGWDGRDRFFLDVEHEGTRERALFEGRTGHPLERFAIVAVDPFDLVVGDIVYATDPDGTVERRSLRADGPAAVRWREPFGDDREEMYDEQSGEELGRGFHGASPDGSRLLLADGNDLHIVDAADGRVVATAPRDDSGSTSVWGVVSTAGGLVVWGRSHVSHWSAHGARVFGCRGQGWFFGDDEHPAWSTGWETCVEDRRGEWPEYDEGVPAWALGRVGRELLVFSAGQILRVDARTLRTTRRVRPPADVTLDCFDEGCGMSARSFGRNVLLHGAAVSLLDPAGRFRPLEGWTHAIADERALLETGDTLRLIDTTGRVRREMPAAPTTLDAEGRRVARVVDGAILVENADDGTELARLATRVERAELHGDALVGIGESESFVWHLPTATLRARHPQPAQLAVDATGEHLAVCAEGRLSLHSVTQGRRVAELGTCELADSVGFVADGRIVAVPSRTQVTLVRVADGRRLVIHGYGDNAFAEDGEHVFATEALADSLRWRGPGALASAPLEPVRARLDPDVLRRFFTFPSADAPTAP